MRTRGLTDGCAAELTRQPSARLTETTARIGVGLSQEPLVGYY